MRHPSRSRWQSIAATVVLCKPVFAETPTHSPEESVTTTPDAKAAEVTIREAPHDVGSHEFRAIDTLSIPGTFGDPLRAVEAMPGVAATLSGLPYFYVRGAPPADTGYFIDGIPVPLLFHLGPGLSVLPP